MSKCEACGGDGKRWYAYGIETGLEPECTKRCWDALPETEEQAEAKGKHYIKGEVETCEVCNGDGVVEENYY
jgi:hypothetical protein